MGSTNLNEVSLFEEFKKEYPDSAQVLENLIAITNAIVALRLGTKFVYALKGAKEDV